MTNQPRAPERRMEPRREEDRVEFHNCPKYVKHDLSEDQVLELIDRGIEIFLARQNQEIGKLTKKGFMYILGALAMGAYTWAISHGFLK